MKDKPICPICAKQGVRVPLVNITYCTRCQQAVALPEKPKKQKSQQLKLQGL